MSVLLEEHLKERAVWLRRNIHVAGDSPTPPQICEIEVHYIGASIERLGGWGLRGRRPRHWADMQVRALLYLGCVRYYTCMRHVSACASIL